MSLGSVVGRAPKIGMALLVVGPLVVLCAVVAGAFVVQHARQQATPAHWLPTSLRTEADSLRQDPVLSHRFYAGTPDSLLVSDDDGATWRRDPGAPRGVGMLALVATAKTPALYGAGSDGAVYRLDRRSGDHWQPISRPFSSSPVYSIALAPDGQVLYAGTSGALMRGQLRGTQWEWRRVVRTDDAAITAITVVPDHPGEVFASVFGVSPPVWRSLDGGLTWKPDTQGLPSALPSQALLSVPHVILSTMGEGVWQRGADGKWREISDGLPERHAMPLVADPRLPTTLFAGTMGFGVYQRQGTASWQRLGRELNGGDYTVLSLAVTVGPHPLLLAATGRGIFRYPIQD